jgi:hypothetical protein
MRREAILLYPENFVPFRSLNGCFFSRYFMKLHERRSRPCEIQYRLYEATCTVLGRQ